MIPCAQRSSIRKGVPVIPLYSQSNSRPKLAPNNGTHQGIEWRSHDILQDIPGAWVTQSYGIAVAPGRASIEFPMGVVRMEGHCYGMVRYRIWLSMRERCLSGVELLDPMMGSRIEVNCL